MLFTNVGEFYQNPGDTITDPLTGLTYRLLAYPPEGDGAYLSGHLTIGGIVKGDTLCTRFGALELTTDPSARGLFSYQTIDTRQTYYASEARSELDLVCQYVDTVIRTPYPFTVGGYPENKHTPLGVKILQRSMSWSGSAVDDFILVTYELENVSTQTIKQIYVGIDVGPPIVFNPMDSNANFYAGHLKDWQSPDGCGYRDTVGVSYLIDTDGRFGDREWSERTPRAAVGIRLLEAPSEAKRRNFNWWTGGPIFVDGQPADLPWGPRRIPQPGEPFRDFGRGLGFPYYDNNYYYLLSHREFDYDQMFAAVDQTSEGFLPPHEKAIEFATHSYADFVYSFGGFDVPPGATAEFTIAIVGGDSIHVDSNAYANYFNPENPTAFYNSLDFSLLANNARWADWVYDNPGIDTDGDGYMGEFRVCDAETTWYKGDG
ncbi:MAG: hypothetical protein SGI97_08030, partial [candidate division Zixibacteria bacterium]|nr:hypothetical protein [candidate division Zixibacteria bacterium]